MSSRRGRSLPKDWTLVIDGIYRSRSVPSYLVQVLGEPQDDSPRLAFTSSSDDGGRTWFMGLQSWRYIAEHCDLTDFRSPEEAHRAAKEADRG